MVDWTCTQPAKISISCFVGTQLQTPVVFIDLVKLHLSNHNDKPTSFFVLTVLLFEKYSKFSHVLFTGFWLDSRGLVWRQRAVRCVGFC